jgi:hypothetical protein
VRFCFNIYQYVMLEIFSYLMAETKDCEMSQICIVSVKFLKDVRVLTEMQQTGNKKVIHRGTSDKICNTFDYMRITFPFEPLTKIGSLRIYFFNQFSESLNLPQHSFLCL